MNTYKLELFEDFIIEGIDHGDCPDFCDAFVQSASYNGLVATDDQLDWLNEQSMFVYELLLERVLQGGE